MLRVIIIFRVAQKYHMGLSYNLWGIRTEFYEKTITILHQGGHHSIFRVGGGTEVFFKLIFYDWIFMKYIIVWRTCC